MPLLHYAPTKTNLLKLKDDLKFAQQGYELLDQKRNILIIELLNIVDQTIDFQNRIDESIRLAHSALQTSVLKMGKNKVLALAASITINSRITLQSKRIMGVVLPVVETVFEEKAPCFSPLHTTFWIDATIQYFKEVLKLLGKLAELKISVVRLSTEVRKTIKKVNALEKIAIPDLQQTLNYIKNRLEENERDMFVLMKMVKNRLEKRKRDTGRNYGKPDA